MAFDYFLNELSYRNVAQNVHEARLRMRKFVATLAALRRASVKLVDAPQLRTDDSFQNATLAEGYTVAKWRGDEEVDRTLRLFFKTYAAQAPYLHSLPEAATEDLPLIYRYSFQDTECLGLGYAHLLRGVAVSLASEEIWSTSSVDVDAHHMTDDTEHQFSVSIPHSSSKELGLNLTSFIERRIEEEARPLSTLGALWEQRATLFSALDFVPEVEEQLKSLEAVQHLNGVLSSLRSYEEYASEWSAGTAAFDHRRMLHVTPESANRLQAFGKQMTFVWEGVPRVFSLHGRFTPGPGRIHMWPNLNERRLVIGYVGMKIQS